MGGGVWGVGGRKAEARDERRLHVLCVQHHVVVVVVLQAYSQFLLSAGRGPLQCRLPTRGTVAPPKLQWCISHCNYIDGK